MALFTSTEFAAASASGADWRDTSKKVLEMLESVKTTESPFSLGFLYISDYLVDDATSILNLFRSVLNIQNWVGAVGMGVCGNGESYIDQPAISAMLGAFDPEEFCVFPGIDHETNQTRETLEPWLKNTDPMLVLVHGDPMAEDDPAQALAGLEQITGGYLMGGLSSSRKEHAQFAGDVFQDCLSGVAFSQKINVATTLSQGCAPIGQPHTVTKGDHHLIHELDSEKASDVFENDLRLMAIKKIDKDPDEILIDEKALHSVETVPEEYQSLFKGEVHAAFPVPGSDRNDYLVRNIIGVEPDEGTIAVSENITRGENILFVYRDNQTLQQDLSKSLVNLRERISRERGCFEPKGAIYISCVARGFSDLDNGDFDEIKLIQDVIGDIPLTGFYASGEISNARIYGYTGILTLFL